MKCKKIMACILCSAVMASFASGCGGGEKTTKADSNEKVTITYGIWDKNQEPTLRKIADKFEEENPNIKVNIELAPWDQYWSKLETAASGGTLADVYWLNGPNIAKYAEGGMVTPLDDLIEKDSYDMSNFPQSLVDLYTVKGKKYAMPKGFDTIGLWYNKEIFDQAGVKYPDETWTWDTYRETAKKLTDKSKGIYGTVAPNANQVNFYNTIFQAGGYVLSDDKKTCGYDKPEAIEGIQFWVDLIKDGSSPTYEQLQDTDDTQYFGSGKVAMGFFGSWSTSEFLGMDALKGKIDVTVLPKKDKRATVIHGIGNVIYSKTKYPEQAWKFVKFLGDKEAMEIQGKDGVDIPAYKPATSTFVDSNKDINLKVFVDELDYSVMYPCSQKTAEWQQLEGDYMKQIWAGKVTPEEGCKKLAAEMNKVLASEK